LRRRGGRGVAATTAVAVSACTALVVVSGCAAGGGVRLEGSASPFSTTPSPSSSDVDSGKVNVAELVRNDPRVGFKGDVRRCPGSGHKYPLTAKYGHLTDSDRPDLLVNLSTCGDGMGLGVYVYEYKDGSYKNVFLEETPPVQGSIQDGILVVNRQVYTGSDAVCCPTGKSVTTFAWNGGWFSEVSHTRSAYGSRSDG
jgi:hypothetical protein